MVDETPAPKAPRRKAPTKPTATGRALKPKPSPEPPVPAPEPIPPRPRDTRLRRRDLAKRLTKDLAGLRSALAEVVDQFEIKIQAKLAALQSVVDCPEGKLPGLPLTTLERAQKALVGLKLKPKKGRFKDLEAIAEAASKMHKALRSRVD